MGNKLIRFAVTLLFVLSPAVAMSAGSESLPEEVLTLQQALDIALKDNPNVENATLTVQEKGDDVDAARTKFLPNLEFKLLEAHNFTNESFVFQPGDLGTFSGVGPIPADRTKIRTKNDFTTHLGVTVTQPLSQLYRTSLGVRKLGVEQDIAEEQLRNQQQETAKQVKEQYYQILETQSSLAATAESILFYRSLLKVVNDKVQEQTALEYESLDVQARLAKQEHESFKDRNDLASQKEKLNNLLGRDTETPFMVTAAPESVPFAMSPEAAQAQALAQRPETREARLKVKEAEYAFKIKQSEYIPNVDLTASYSHSNTEFIPDDSFYVGLLVKWEFFDWGRKSSELSARRAGITQARNSVRQADSQVVAEVNSKIRDLDDAKNAIGVARIAQKAAREKLRVEMNRYEDQAALLKDVLQAESELANANNDFNKAVLSVWTARAELDKALGEE